MPLVKKDTIRRDRDQFIVWVSDRERSCGVTECEGGEEEGFSVMFSAILYANNNSVSLYSHNTVEGVITIILSILEL